MIKKRAIIEGLYTEGSIERVREALSKVNNVASVTVSREEAFIEGDTSDEDIVTAVEEAGFNINMLQEI